MTVAIYSRGLDAGQQAQLLTLLTELQKHQVSILLFDSFSENYRELTGDNRISLFSDSESLTESTDCLISLGGDGTMLDAVALVRNKNIPILGINFGRLGFLAGIGKEELASAVDALVNGTYVIDKRSLIHLDAEIPLFGDTPFGLNEFAIHKRDTSPMIKIH